MRTTDFMRMSHAQAAMKASDIAYENEQLRQQLAEKDVEIERLSRLNSSYSNLTKAQEGQLTALRNRLYELKGADKTLDSERDANAILTEQLAASQAREQRLREALENLSLYVAYNGDDWVQLRAKEALALPADTSALEAVKAEVAAKAGECMRERAIKQCKDIYSWPGAYSAGSMSKDTLTACGNAIRALPGVTMEDIK